MALGQDVVLEAVVAFIRCHVADGAVPVLTVVPGDEANDPLLCRVDAGKGQMRVCRGVLQGSEERL